MEVMHALPNVSSLFASGKSEEDSDVDEPSFVANLPKRSSCAETARMFKLRRGLDQLDCIYQQKEHDVQKARYYSGYQQTLHSVRNLESTACRKLYWNFLQSARGHF